MLWTDIYEIVDELIENHSETDPEKILFVDLRKMVIDLDGFSDDPDRSNEEEEYLAGTNITETPQAMTDGDFEENMEMDMANANEWAEEGEV